MKLLYVTDNGFAYNNGKYFYDSPNATHISYLKNFFDEFIIVARKNPYIARYEEILGNISITLVSKWNIMNLNKTIIRLIQNCDAVICYCNNGYFAAKAGKKANKVVISYVGGDPYELLICRKNISGKILAPIARYMWRTRVRNSDFVHYCHEFFYDKYPTSGKRLACSGVNIICDENVLQRRIKKIDTITSRNRFILGLIGYTKNKIKGIDRAIKAISELGENYYLEIVGRGETEEYIQFAEQLHCADRIKFKGVLNSKEILNWLDSIDIYIQPSRAEGLPRATIEAMSRGCPVVCSNAGALSQIINNKFVFTQDTPDKFSKMISDISNFRIMRIEAENNFNKSRAFEKSERERKYREFYTIIVDEVKKRNLTK